MPQCSFKKCSNLANVRDDETFEVWCWDHKQGRRHLTCGCEHDLVTFDLVVKCERHGEIIERIKDMARRTPKKKLKSQKTKGKKVKR